MLRCAGRPVAGQHIHPDASEPRDIYIKRFKGLDEVAGYIAARKAASEAQDNSQAMAIMKDFWAE